MAAAAEKLSLEQLSESGAAVDAARQQAGLGWGSSLTLTKTVYHTRCVCCIAARRLLCFW